MKKVVKEVSPQGRLFAQAMKRPKDYEKASEQRQWEIDKGLGILDWDGSCPHKEGQPCKDCAKKYRKRGA